MKIESGDFPKDATQLHLGLGGIRVQGGFVVSENALVPVMIFLPHEADATPVALFLHSPDSILVVLRAFDAIAEAMTNASVAKPPESH